MFSRKIERDLSAWKSKKGRKPLIFRGARQTGKTTLVRKLGSQFKNFIELNLEKDESRKIFSEVRDIRKVVQSIEGISGRRVIPDETLLFLDEIQNSATAIKLLRYFYEEIPGLHVIAAGSLLEVRMKSEGWSFPVGRVEYLYLYPVTFDEFLSVTGEEMLLEALNGMGIESSFHAVLHDKLLNLLSDYMFLGGMPEAVNEYIKSRSFLAVRQYHETLVSSFKEDFAKYSKGAATEHLIQVWDRVPFEVGRRIHYSKLAGMQARSADISTAFDVLHEAMLVERIFPTTQTSLPLVKKSRAAPKALFLDTGLCTRALNLTREQVQEQIIDPFYKGGLLEAFVGQELLAFDFRIRDPLFFWIREEKGTSSELDFLVQVGNDIVPLEVKSGSHGSLKSLHQFLLRSPHRLGVRLCNQGSLKIENHSVSLPDGRKLKYRLLSIPFYLVFRVREIIKKAL
ncbi:MAG: ATP-binding protein [Deltaproteobacteria bacterium]|nr:ATP-binding protein [Deltaproteobacteria bacterium]